MLDSGISRIKIVSSPAQGEQDGPRREQAHMSTNKNKKKEVVIPFVLCSA
jgi:hypothetical protein